MPAPAATRPTPDLDGGLGGFHQRWKPLLERIRSGAIERERSGESPRPQIDALLAAGFGVLRLPIEQGGLGASVEETFAAVIDLASADASVAHVFRGHTAFIDEALLEGSAPVQDEILREIAAGKLIGLAGSELTNTSQIQAALGERDGQLLLEGTKYYTTGSIYADWIQSSGVHHGARVKVIVDAHDPGVTSIDDWDGFGQKQTGSGTTVFHEVPARIVKPYIPQGLTPSFLSAYFQNYLLAVVAGILEAALQDTIAFVQPRKRTFGVDGESLPRENPLVQSVVGELAAAAHATRGLVLAEARSLDRLRTLDPAHPDTAAAFSAVELDIFGTQQIVLRLALDAAAELFEVGGSSAVSGKVSLDRHWRNIRTIASHNPARQRQRALGDYLLNGTLPAWRVPAAAPTAPAEPATRTAP